MDSMPTAQRPDVMVNTIQGSLPSESLLNMQDVCRKAVSFKGLVLYKTTCESYSQPRQPQFLPPPLIPALCILRRGRGHLVMVSRQLFSAKRFSFSPQTRLDSNRRLMASKK
ncbi:hypothetical protein ACTXT7_008209 [Hymenolepis weldensis]